MFSQAIFPGYGETLTPNITPPRLPGKVRETLSPAVCVCSLTPSCFSLHAKTWTQYLLKNNPSVSSGFWMLHRKMRGTRNGRSAQCLILGSCNLLAGIEPGGAGLRLWPLLCVPTVQEAALDLSQLRSLPRGHQWTSCTHGANCGGKGSAMLV